jgi:hypothetical protein
MHQLQTNKQQLYQPISELLGDFVKLLKPISFVQDLLEFYVELLGTKASEEID